MKKLIIVPLLFILSLNVSAQSKALTNETIWKDYAFYNESVSGVRSMNDGENYTSLVSDPKSGMTTIKKFPYNSESQPESIIDLSALIFVGSEGKKRIKINDYQFNADETKILLATEQESIYRHSTKAYYYVYDIETKKMAELSESSKGKQRLAQFAPLGNKIAFVRENNIFITNLDEKQEIQITSGGKMNEMIFGATDWVYEEEFSFDNGLYWSPDGRKIAYYYFDESKVKQFQLAMYDGLYPSQYEFKYPKAGEDNSVVQVFVYELSSKRTSAFDTGIDTDIYLPRIKWTNDPDVLMVTRMNRLQNKLELMIGDFDETRPNNTGVRTKVIYSEESETYIDITDNLTFLSDNKSFLWSSEKDGYNHLYRINLKDGSSSQLTSGKWDVTELVGVDEENKLIYYLSAEESPMERDLFTIKLNGSSKKKISTRKGQNEVAFSKGFKYYINYHSDANSPYYITLNNSTGEELKTLKDNQRVKDAMNQYGFVEKEFIKIKTKEGIELNAYMMKPQEFKETHQHPVFMHVYGGPGINTVHDAWGGQNLRGFSF